MNIEAIKANLEAARAEVSRLCDGEDAGKWRMSIPADARRDSDLLISAALNDAERLLEVTQNNARTIRELLDDCERYQAEFESGQRRYEHRGEQLVYTDRVLSRADLELKAATNIIDAVTDALLFLPEKEQRTIQSRINTFLTIRETTSKVLPLQPIVPKRHVRPPVVCLCGSTRFYDAFQRANYEETMAGKIVLSVGFYRAALAELETGPRHEYHGENIGCTPEQKIALDELHKRKIDLADEIYVLNVGGYIGESTRSEIEYAEAQGKPIRYLVTS